MSRSQPEFPVIAPSMLKCDFSNLEREIRRLEEAGAETLHLDVMDGHFVPNLSYGPMVIESLRKRTNLVLDAHLMISNPEKYLDNYVAAGCDWITIHIEAAPRPESLLRAIRQAGCLAGLAINPDTPVSAIVPFRAECDLVLVMSVHPGFGGQTYIAGSEEKVRAVKQEFGPGVLASIDGGIGPDTIGTVAAAGADVFVTGSSIFDRSDYAAAVSEMAQLARTHRC